MSTGANDVAGAAAGGWRDTLEATSRYYLGIPRVKTPDFRIFWSGEQMFKRVLRVGRPVVVSLMVPGEAGCHAFEEQLKLASAEFYKKVIFLQVNCAEAEDFCRSRAPSQLPSVEVFVPVTENGVANGRVKIYKFDYHKSVYGLREFFRHNEILPSSSE